MAERALLRTLEGGCQVPVGGHATVNDGELELSAVICSLDGVTVIEGSIVGRAEASEEIGSALAEDLLSRGGAAILQGIRLIHAIKKSGDLRKK